MSKIKKLDTIKAKVNIEYEIELWRDKEDWFHSITRFGIGAHWETLTKTIEETRKAVFNYLQNCDWKKETMYEEK
jgi:hypothetical protein